MINTTLENCMVKVNGYSSQVKECRVRKERHALSVLSYLSMGGALGSSQRADGSTESRIEAGVVQMGCG